MDAQTLNPLLTLTKPLSASELLRLKAAAAHFVAAGAVVVWDAVDAITGIREEKYKLAVANGARVATGSAAISGAITTARHVTAPLWLIRFNIVTAIATGAVTITIGKLRSVAWANWLQAQPFRSALIRKDEAQSRAEDGMGPARQNTKLSYRSEQEMMHKLVDALAEID